MQVTVKTSDPSQSAADVLALPLLQAAGEEDTRLRLPAAVRALDRRLGGVIATALEAGDFVGRAGQIAVLYPQRPAGARAKGPAPTADRAEGTGTSRG